MSALADKKQDDRDAAASKRRRSQEVADWEAVDRDVLVKAIAAAAMKGGALRLGYSRDGYVYSIGVYGDGQPYTEWAKGVDDLHDVLLDITDTFEEKALADEVGDGKVKAKKRPK